MWPVPSGQFPMSRWQNNSNRVYKAENWSLVSRLSLTPWTHDEWPKLDIAHAKFLTRDHEIGQVVGGPFAKSLQDGFKGLRTTTTPLQLAPVGCNQSLILHRSQIRLGALKHVGVYCTIRASIE